MRFDESVPAAQANFEKELFTITLDFIAGDAKGLDVAGTAGATQKIVTTIDQAYHFVIVGGVRVVTDFATDLVPVAFLPAVFDMTMTSSSRGLMNSPVHVEALFGTAQLPAVWAKRRFIQAGSSMTTTVQNLAATQYNLRLVLLGYQILLP